jgi:hypothetical protein
MSFQREYTERMDWLKQQFKDWAFTMMTIFFYYEELDQVAGHSLRRGIGINSAARNVLMSTGRKNNHLLDQKVLR